MFWYLKRLKPMLRKKQPNKALHSDKIKLRSFFATLYFAGELGRYEHNKKAPKHFVLGRESTIVFVF